MEEIKKEENNNTDKPQQDEQKDNSNKQNENSSNSSINQEALLLEVQKYVDLKISEFINNFNKADNINDKKVDNNTANNNEEEW